MSKRLYGRTEILTSFDEINDSNIAAVIEKARGVHMKNRSEIEYLYNYYKGKQPIIGRKKDIRPEIKNIIVENRANEIVSFKVGFLMNEPVQYVNRSGDKSEAVNRLNEYVFSENKANGDKELVEWFTICGTAYRMVLPDPDDRRDYAPFELYTLDPRDTFLVYHSGLGHRRMLGVFVAELEDGSDLYCAYTDRMYYELKNGIIVKKEPHSLGVIPIYEYRANKARLGAFEIVLPLLDSINNVASNRMDAVEQFVQSLLVIKNVDLNSDEFSQLKEKGGLLIPSDGDVKYLTQELNQMQTQTLVDHMYQTVLTICGMPNRNGGSSTSDTGKAVIIRDGWSAAEARAKDAEDNFKAAESECLGLMIKISNELRNTDLKPSDVDIRFTRRNYENILEKSQVLTTLLNCPGVHPRLAFEHSGLFIDPDLAYKLSAEYAQQSDGGTENE